MTDEEFKQEILSRLDINDLHLKIVRKRYDAVSKQLDSIQADIDRISADIESLKLKFEEIAIEKINN